jgi:hypothetical protein
MTFTYDQLHSTQGHRLTRSLFKETCKPGDVPIMTLGRKPKEGLVQLAPIFLELVTDDPSEYELGLAVLGSYAHWKLIAEATWMVPYLQEWRMETDVRRKSGAFRRLHTEAIGGGRAAFTAAKYLIEEPWKDKRNPKAKAEVQKSSTKAASGYDEDMIRLKDHM